MRTHRPAKHPAQRPAHPRHPQTGFTLIELVMVIVILAVLSAVAIPKFVDLGSDAKSAALASVAGSLTSASAVNYAARKANSSNGYQIDDCASLANALQGGLPDGYTITAAPVAANATVACTLTQTATGNTTTFSATGIN